MDFEDEFQQVNNYTEIKQKKSSNNLNKFAIIKMSDKNNIFLFDISDNLNLMQMNIWERATKIISTLKNKTFFRLKTISSNRRTLVRWTLGINVATFIATLAYRSEDIRPIISKQVQFMADTSIPIFLRKYIFGAYSRYYSVNMNQIEQPLQNYSTLSSFFTRKIHRPQIEVTANTIASPCDGQVLAFSQITEDRCQIIKNVSYSLSELILGSTIQQPINLLLKKEKENKLYQVILYLAPGDYHRFHAPVNMQILKLKEISGRCDPVNEKSLLRGRPIYQKNGRKTLISEWQQGVITMVMVGAFNVTRIQITNQQTLKAGDELGYFNLGSTIVMLIETKGIKQWKVKEGQKVKYGEPLFEFTSER